MPPSPSPNAMDEIFWGPGALKVISDGVAVSAPAFDVWNISEGYEKKWAISGGGGTVSVLFFS